MVFSPESSLTSNPEEACVILLAHEQSERKNYYSVENYQLLDKVFTGGTASFGYSHGGRRSNYFSIGLK
jgi:hypothetical protein